MEHLFLALLDSPSPSVKDIFKEYGITKDRFLKALSTVRGNQRVTSDNPEATYDTLNEKQREAVLHTEGPLLILAGAGSGKTRVLTHRIAYLIEEKGVNPWNILAITFTNKAAGEMRDRVDFLVKSGAASVWVSTFHSLCVRILRRFIDYLGYENNFTIYDSDDQKTLMKQIIKKLNLDPKQYRERGYDVCYFQCQE